MDYTMPMSPTTRLYGRTRAKDAQRVTQASPYLLCQECDRLLLMPPLAPGKPLPWCAHGQDVESGASAPAAVEVVPACTSPEEVHAHTPLKQHPVYQRMPPDRMLRLYARNRIANGEGKKGITWEVKWFLWCPTCHRLDFTPINRNGRRAALCGHGWGKFEESMGEGAEECHTMVPPLPRDWRDRLRRIKKGTGVGDLSVVVE